MKTNIGKFGLLKYYILGIIMFICFSNQNVYGAGSKETVIGNLENDYQIVTNVLQRNKYPTVVVQIDKPVKWIIDANEENINGCNGQMVLREYDIEYKFKPGENIIEFIPSKTGNYRYSCWMGMIRGTIVVVEDIDNIKIN
jgi:plastocyanin domain-containing protein